MEPYYRSSHTTVDSLLLFHLQVAGLKKWNVFMVISSHTNQAGHWIRSNWCLEMNNHDKPPLLWWKVGDSFVV